MAVNLQKNTTICQAFPAITVIYQFARIVFYFTPLIFEFYSLPTFNRQ